MSPRKSNVITVEAWPKLAGKLYQGKVTHASIEKASSRLAVTIENRDPSQQGRIHRISLLLPVRPGNQASTFLSACGVKADSPGATISLDQVVGALVNMRFRGMANGFEDFAFEKLRSSSGTEPSSEGADRQEQPQVIESSEDGATDEAKAKGPTW